jgi:integrase
MAMTDKKQIATIGEMIDFYEQHHVRFLKDWKGKSRILRQYVGQLADLPLSALSRRKVIEWHHAIGEARGCMAANHALQSLHAMYVKAQDWEIYDGKNPADRVKKYKKASRTRFVQPHELPWLLKSIAEEIPKVETYFLCLLFTGARRDEARTMKWKDLDLERALWHKPTTKTDVPHTIPLPQVLLEKIQQLPRINEWVFPSAPNQQNNYTPGQWCGTAVFNYWRRIRRRAGLHDVRIHDLRRTTASWLACDGENLSIIQRTLNHSSLAVTQVYARLTVEPVRRALENQAQRMLNPRPIAQMPSPLPKPTPTPDETIESEWPG